MKLNTIQRKNHAMKQNMTHEMQPNDRTKSHIYQGFMTRFSTWIITCVITFVKALPVIAAGTMASSDAATLVSFTPTASGTTAAPIVGMSAAGSDYLLTGTDTTRRLAQDFTGNGKDVDGFGNPSTAKDAASFNTDYHFQLSTTDTIRQVNTTTGVSNSNFTPLNITGNTFGIGYNASTDTLGVGVTTQNGIDVHLYNTVSNLSGNTPSSTISFAFDQAQWGTPSGMDLVFAGGMYRILLGTRDQNFNFDDDPINNFVLDINGNTGLVDQYFSTAGTTNKLNDLHYDPQTGQLALGYQSGVGGGVERGFFSPIPEPSTALLGGLGALGLAMRRKRTDKVENKYD